MKDNFQKANSVGEVLDLVDKNDVVIGTVDRQLANQNSNLIHREIAVILVTKENKVILQKRSNYKIVHPGWWSVLAGHVSAGEDPAKVAVRELEEEFGINSISLKFHSKKYLKYENESHFMYYFIGKYNGEIINFDKAEVSQVIVVSYSEIEQMIKSGETVNTKHLPIIKEIINEN